MQWWTTCLTGANIQQGISSQVNTGFVTSVMSPTLLHAFPYPCVAQVVSVEEADHTVVLQELFSDTSRQVAVPFTAKRAADFRPGMAMGCTLVTLSDGSCFITDWGYVFPSFYAPLITSKEAFGPFDHPELVYPPEAPQLETASSSGGGIKPLK